MRIRFVVMVGICSGNCNRQSTTGPYRAIVNAFYLALVFTGIVVLDYLWEFLAKKYEKFAHTSKLKLAVVCVLLLAGWVQAIVQYRKDVESDKDMEYLKHQLALANVSLTNTTLTIKGMNDGGDSYAEPTFGFSEGENLLSIYLQVNGQYPLRSVTAKVINETKRIEAGISHTTPVPPSATVVERFVGDLSQHWWNMGPHLCNVPLDPAITNYIRVDLTAVNGSSEQIYDLSKVTNGWKVALHYRLRRIQEKVTVDPTNYHGAILVY